MCATRAAIGSWRSAGISPQSSPKGATIDPATSRSSRPTEPARAGCPTMSRADPGQMDTGMQDNIRRAAASGTYFPGQQRWIDAHAEGRLADPMTVAERILKEHAP